MSEPSEGYEGALLATFHDEETHEHVIVVYRDRADGTVEYLVAANWWLIADANEDPRSYCVAKLPCYVYNVLLSVAERGVVEQVAGDVSNYFQHLLGQPPEEQLSDEPF